MSEATPQNPLETVAQTLQRVDLITQGASELALAEIGGGRANAHTLAVVAEYAGSIIQTLTGLRANIPGSAEPTAPSTTQSLYEIGERPKAEELNLRIIDKRWWANNPSPEDMPKNPIRVEVWSNSKILMPDNEIIRATPDTLIWLNLLLLNRGSQELRVGDFNKIVKLNRPNIASTVIGNVFRRVRSRLEAHTGNEEDDRMIIASEAVSGHTRTYRLNPRSVFFDRRFKDHFDSLSTFG